MSNITNIKIEILKSGYKQKELAKKLGIGPTYLSWIVNGQRTPSLKLAFKIANQLKKPVDELFPHVIKEDQEA